MGLKGDKIFTLKTYGSNLYKWAPIPNLPNKNGQKGGKQPFFCTAPPGSQGEDWITGYMYTLVVTNGQQHKYAYVECGYVQ